MNTALALPEEPPDKCAECGATLAFHLDHLQGVNYVEPKDIKARWVYEWETPSLDLPDIKTCHIYKLRFFG